MVNIKNKRTIELMEQHGDNLKQSRQVRHWAYFKNKEDRQAFIEEVQEIGYLLGYESEHKGHTLPLGVCFHKSHHVSQDSMDSVFAQLSEVAESCGGEYDGWETEVIRSLQ